MSLLHIVLRRKKQVKKEPKSNEGEKKKRHEAVSVLADLLFQHVGWVGPIIDRSLTCHDTCREHGWLVDLHG